MSRSIFTNLFTAILLTIWAVPAYAQLSANFTANRTEGCAPLVVQFTDQSTGGATEWRWDLGNGTLSFLKDPAATYFNPGTYTVKLVIRNGAQSDSVVKVNYITVYASPVVNFVASDTNGCYPLPVLFNDLSTPGDGTITSWLWDFGDGDTSALPNPQHIYENAGNYNVSLQVRNSRGCIQSITRLNYIKLNTGVKADFSVGSSANCRPPTPISFINASSGTGALTYQWLFGDGGTSTQANPTHTYTTAGSYTVRLIVRNNSGCVDSMVIPNAVVIGTVDAAFTSPATVCAGQAFQLLNNSSPSPSGAIWTFGDNTSSNALNPFKTYQVPGTYQVKLVSLFGACRDSVIRNIQVLDKPTSAFTAVNTSACKPPLSVNFTQTSSNAVSYKWFFGDGDSSSAANPTHVYTSYGTFTVRLITTNAAGCTDTLRMVDFVRIQQPQVSITNIPQEGCVPYTYRPGFSIVSTDSIVRYEWHFGDGNTSDQRNPVYTYTTPGLYTVKLFYTTSGGCSDSVIATNAIRVGEKPVVNFTATPRTGCAFSPIRFNDLSTGPVGDRWFWEFGDGGTSTERNPTYTYNDTGWFSVKLVVWNNGCMDSLTIPRFIHIKPPVAKFIDSSVCSGKFTRWFLDRSVGATSWFWEFGDGTTSTLQNPVHTYSTPGSFLVTLTVKNDTCEHTTTRQIVIVSEIAAFTATDTIVCKGVFVNFQAASPNLQNIRSFRWNFGDGSFGSGPAPRHIYTTPGTYSVELIITDINGCNDTLRRLQYIRVNGPTAAFTAINPAVCNLTTVRFADSSVSDGINPIKQWIWNYGDGIIDTLTAPPFEHTYITAGIFTVRLTVVDSLGCTDFSQRNSYLIISKPAPAFISPDTLSCTDKPIRFINQTTGNGPLQYEWNFGNAAGSSAIQPVATYTAEGDYTVKLVVTDRYGCKDSVTRPAYVHIRNPRSIFTISDSVATCPPLVVNFSNQSQNFIRHEWDFGDGTRSLVSNPVHFYSYPGVYRAKLTVTSVGGCTDTLVRTITVRGPQGTFRYDNFGGCEPTTVRFTGMTKDTVSFIWDFNDGTVVETGDSIITHTYTRRGVYLPKMILKDPQGCQVSIPGRDTIRIYGVDAKFGTSAQVLCDSGLVQFRDSSSANELITSYRWDFGNGQTSTLRNPSHYYRQPGTYPIQLIVRTISGCVDTMRLPVPVKISVSPIVSMRADTGACVPALAQFSASVVRTDTSALQWRWDFGNGSVSALQNPLPVSYAVAGDYAVQLVATNSLGCADTVDHVYTAFPIPDIDAGLNRVICREAVTDLVATGGVRYTWAPSPSLSCTDCAAPKANPLVNTLYHVQGRNIYGCVANDSVLITVQQPFKIEVGRGDTLCVGETIQLFASGADQFLWSPVTGLDNSSIDKPKAKPSNSIVYQVVGRDNHGCFTDTGHVPVVVYPYPTVDAGEDQNISVGSSIAIDAKLSNDVNAIRWFPPAGLNCVTCPKPIASPKQTTTYTVEVMNQGGCITRDDVTVFVFCEGSNLFMPNTFSPNGDGNNDVFYPRGKGLFMIKSFRIFNRWGEMVYQKSNFGANDASGGWNGSHNGKLSPQDVYVYTIEVMCENQVVLKYNGNIALIR